MRSVLRAVATGVLGMLATVGAVALVCGTVHGVGLGTWLLVSLPVGALQGLELIR
jgi:hypothetical protein